MTALPIEPLEARQMLAAQPLTGSSTAEIPYAMSLTAPGNFKPVASPSTPIVSTILPGGGGSTGGSTGGFTGVGRLGGSLSPSGSTVKSQTSDSYSTGLVATMAPSVWQSGASAPGPSVLTLGGLTSLDAAPNPIRFVSLGNDTPSSDHSNSPFAQATVLEWQPFQLAGDPSAVDDAEVVKAVAPDDAGVAQLRFTSSARESAQPSPTIFGEQWGARAEAFYQWVLRDGQSSDRPMPQAESSAPGVGRQGSQDNSARMAARAVAPASISQRAFDSLAYFAEVGGAIGIAANANTALTAQRIQQILFACRRATVDVIKMSIRVPLSASAKAAVVLLLGTVLAFRAARPRDKHKERASLSDQELMAASGVAMSSAWLCFRLGSPRSRP
jgi:hypothetical protein